MRRLDENDLCNIEAGLDGKLRGLEGQQIVHPDDTI